MPGKDARQDEAGGMPKTRIATVAMKRAGGQPALWVFRVYGRSVKNLTFLATPKIIKSQQVLHLLSAAQAIRRHRARQIGAFTDKKQQCSMVPKKRKKTWLNM